MEIQHVVFGFREPGRGPGGIAPALVVGSFDDIDIGQQQSIVLGDHGADFTWEEEAHTQESFQKVIDSQQCPALMECPPAEIPGGIGFGVILAEQENHRPLAPAEEAVVVQAGGIKARGAAQGLVTQQQREPAWGGGREHGNRVPQGLLQVFAQLGRGGADAPDSVFRNDNFQLADAILQGDQMTMRTERNFAQSRRGDDFFAFRWCLIGQCQEG